MSIEDDDREYNEPESSDVEQEIIDLSETEEDTSQPDRTISGTVLYPGSISAGIS